MRTNFILIDFENVRPEALDRLTGDHFKVLVFVGANQTKLSLDFAASMQRLGTRGEYVRISGNGPNALDFHIAFYLGVLASEHPTAYFHLISKDKGFDPLIAHLKARKILVGRVPAISDIPLLKAANGATPADKLDAITAKLSQLKASKPRTVRTLGSTIAALFLKQLSEEEVAALINGLSASGAVSIDGTKVTYHLRGAE